ncbi:transcription factor bHLH90-like [Silene latifolia]|uniref:transcription factor bHLH90-like n=1 Tax=Silene latifolia TaxID=37657 RepID=UPI003D7857DB
MGHLETPLEKLRPLIVGSNTWDYCVVWKLGDDPSRFLEWVGCCCNGGGKQEVGNKMKNRDTNCRDTNFVHPAKTKSCQALARLPLFMSLHSGIHGEVVILGQSRWISVTNTNTPDSNPPNQDLEGTRLLIPVVGGLVELFSTDNIPENEIVMEFLKCQFCCSETVTVSNSTITFDEKPYLNPLLENNLDTCPQSLNQLSFLRFAQTLNQQAHTHSDSTMGGSSTGSFPSPDSTPFSASQAMPKEESQGTQMVEKKSCKSKNLLTERNRRRRISDGMLKLRSLVPKITKMHKAATLSDAIDYIKELENERLNLLDELKDSSNTTYDTASYLNPEVVEPKVLAPLNPKQLTSSLTKRSISQDQVKVNQLGTGNYLVRVACQQSLGAFTKVLEAVGSLDVLVDDVNSTVYDDTMLSYFLVQTKNQEMQEKDIRDSLMLLVV